MKKILIISIVMFTFISTLSAQDGIGVGIIAGEPTGLSGKMWMADNTAIDLGMAWSFSGEKNSFHIHGDYLWHNFSLIKVDQGKLPLYFGVGARARFGVNANIGVRIPVGLAYIFEQAPVDIFLEMVPIMDLIPDTRFDFNGGVGARVYF